MRQQIRIYVYSWHLDVNFSYIVTKNSNHPLSADDFSKREILKISLWLIFIINAWSKIDNHHKNWCCIYYNPKTKVNTKIGDVNIASPLVAGINSILLD